MNGADALVAALQAHGVTWLSTLCGHGLNDIYAACRRAGLRLVDTRNEQTAAYAAEAWGRLSGRAGVCAVSSGVAHANALTGVVNAHFDGAPMLLITGAGPLATAGQGHFQDFDQVALASPVCKYARVLDRADRVPELVHEALGEARAGRPGPVHLTFPMDAQTEACSAGLATGPAPPEDRPPSPSPEAARRAAQLLAASRRPLIVAGSGVFYGGAGRQVADFASAWAVPCAVPIWDRGSVAEARPEYLGVLGGASGGPRLLEEADLVIMLGAAADYRVGYLQSPPLREEAAVIRVDVDPARLHHMGRADLAVLAAPGPFVDGLGEACAAAGAGGFEEWLAEARRRRDDFDAGLRSEPGGGALRDTGLTSLEVCDAVAAEVPEEAVLVADGGNIGQWFHQTLGSRRYPGTWLTCGASGVVGYGVGAAMAARLGFPRRPVVLLSGDGAATFNLTDLECAARQGLPFVMIVADDEAWGITLSGHLGAFGEPLSSALGAFDFAAMAEACGAIGVRVEDVDHLREALRRGLGESRPVVLHAPIRGGLPQ